MAITDTDVATGGLGYAIADAIIQFNKANVFFNLVSTKLVSSGAIYGRFPVYTKVAASSVTENAAGAEGADTSATDITTTPVDIEVLRYSIRADVTDLASDGNADNLFGNSGLVLGNAVAAKFDRTVYADMSASIASTVGTGSVGLTLDVIYDGIQTLKNEGVAGPYSAVLNPRQIWGTNGISSELISSGNAVNPVGSEMITNGYVSNLAGVNIYYTDQIGAADYGVLFGKDAQGVAYKDMAGNGTFIAGEQSRNAEGALTKIVANGYFSTDQLNASSSVMLVTKLA